MPTLKKYTFENLIGFIKTQIIIEAYNFTQAYERLVEVTKHPADYKCTNV